MLKWKRYVEEQAVADPGFEPRVGLAKKNLNAVQ
jgi:hypothetical protein